LSQLIKSELGIIRDGLPLSLVVIINSNWKNISITVMDGSYTTGLPHIAKRLAGNLEEDFKAFISNAPSIYLELEVSTENEMEVKRGLEIHDDSRYPPAIILEKY